MIWFEDEVRSLEQKVQNSSFPHRPTVFYGSSSIRLWSTLAQDFPDQPVLNLGFGGSTMAACSWYFERLVVPAHPQSIICYAGDNDLGDGRLAEEVFLFFSTLITQVQRRLPEVPFTYVSIKSSPARWEINDRIRLANKLIQTQLEQLPACHYIDVNTPMLDRQGLPRPELFEKDGLHLNPQGYALWCEVIKKHPQIFNHSGKS